MAKLKIGIAGVGLMGLGIATNIAKAGWPLFFLEHWGNQPVDCLLEAGAQGCANGKILAEHSDIIILCVTGSPQVEDILTRADGILTGAKPNALIVDCSTAIPSSTIEVANKVKAAGARFMDAPMTRTPKEAMEGRLNLIVGAEQADFEEALPLLKSFAENIVHVGGVGAGHSMKLLHNYVSLGYTAVLAEAAATASKAGIDPHKFVEVLAKGGGGSVVLDRLKPFILDGDSSGLKFSISNAQKDIGYYTQMSEDLGAANGTAKAVLALLGEEVESDNGALMMPELIRLLQQ